MKAVAYCRVSGQGQVSGDGFPRQIAAIREYCRLHDMECIGEYFEEAVPGKLGEEHRPAFQEMVAALLSNGCRTIVIEGMHRLARQYDIQQQLITYLACKGITLISADTGEDITAALMGDPMRRAMVQIQGVLSELDKNMIVAKLKSARDRIRKDGRRPGTKNFSLDPTINTKPCGRKSFGEKAGEERTLDEIRLLRRHGLTYQLIADAMNDTNAPTRSGQPWRASVVAKILARDKNRPAPAVA